MSANHHLVFSRNKSSQTLTITNQNSNLVKTKVLRAMRNMVARKAILTNKQDCGTAKGKLYAHNPTINSIA